MSPWSDVILVTIRTTTGCEPVARFRILGHSFAMLSVRLAAHAAPAFERQLIDRCRRATILDRDSGRIVQPRESLTDADRTVLAAALDRMGRVDRRELGIAIAVCLIIAAWCVAQSILAVHAGRSAIGFAVMAGLMLVLALSNVLRFYRESRQTSAAR